MVKRSIKPSLSNGVVPGKIRYVMSYHSLGERSREKRDFIGFSSVRKVGNTLFLFQGRTSMQVIESGCSMTQCMGI